jgi:hypothetical protein
MFVGIFAPSVLNAVYKKRSLAAKDTFIRSSSIATLSAGPGYYRESDLEIKYSSEMCENVTAVLRLSYTVRSIQVGPEKYGQSPNDVASTETIDILDADLGIFLTSSGFKVEPKEGIKRKAGAPLPIMELWTVTPEAPGSKVLLFTRR